MTVKHDCSKKWVWAVTGSHRCFRNATVERDGKWWCWQHDPERVKIDREKRRAGWQAKMDRKDAKYARIARNARLAALVTPELATLLEKAGNLTTGSKGWTSIGLFTSQDGEKCHELAACIREALEVTDED